MHASRHFVVDGIEHLHRIGPACNQGCHPPQPRLMLGKLTQRVAAGLEHGPGFAELLFLFALPGDIAANRIKQSPMWRDAPIDPPRRTVAAGGPIFETNGSAAIDKFLDRLAQPIHVFRRHQLKWGGRQIVHRVAQGVFEGRIDMEQLALIGNDHQVGRQLEELFQSLMALDQSVVDVLAVAGGGEQGFKGGQHAQQALARHVGQIVWHLEDPEYFVVVTQRDRSLPVITGRIRQVHGRELQV